MGHRPGEPRASATAVYTIGEVVSTGWRRFRDADEHEAPGGVATGASRRRRFGSIPENQKTGL